MHVHMYSTYRLVGSTTYRAIVLQSNNNTFLPMWDFTRREGLLRRWCIHLPAATIEETTWTTERQARRSLFAFCTIESGLIRHYGLFSWLCIERKQWIISHMRGPPPLKPSDGAIAFCCAHSYAMMYLAILLMQSQRRKQQYSGKQQHNNGLHISM